jgi:hypothetical protein
MAATRLPRAEHFGVLASAPHSSAAARLDDLSVREDNTLPPEILLPGARQSQGVKCLALGHALRPVPHSPTSINASDGPNPWISVRSTPSTPNSAVVTSKVGVLICLVLMRGVVASVIENDGNF